MPRRSQGSARPDEEPTHLLNRVCRSGELGSGVGLCADGADACDPAALDRVLFDPAAPFVGITASNVGEFITRDRGVAQQWLAEESAVATVAGTLRECVLAADVDPADSGAPAEAGQAAAEELVARVEELGLPWLLRESGRAGGRHVLVVGELGQEDWRRWCHRASARHGVGVQPRRTLRLLTAPHRVGLPAPVVAGTLQPSDLPDAGPMSSYDSSRRRSPRRSRRVVSSTPLPGDRSRREYGDALARARAGWSAARTYAALAVPGSKAEEHGEHNWRRWVWSRAVTVVAAERGSTEEQAWSEFEEASRRRSRELGRETWRELYWHPALHDAGEERPRRRRLDAASSSTGSEHDGEVEQVRAGLHAAVAAALAIAPRRPQFRRSVAAALDALAPVLVRRAGSIAERAWAEAAQLSRSTLRKALAWITEHGILCRARTYSGGTADSASWALGPRSHAAMPSPETRSTGGTPPPAPTVGRADPDRSRRLHKREQQSREADFSLVTDNSVSPEPNSKAHRTARSLVWQRRWWQTLTKSEKEARRRVRRELLDTLHPSRRRAWLTWLNHRDDLETAVQRLVGGRPARQDLQSLAAAPATVHRGIRDLDRRNAAAVESPASVAIELGLAA